MSTHQTIAVWAITPNGAKLAEKITGKLPSSTLYLSETIPFADNKPHRFSGLKKTVQRCYFKYSSHIFIMSTGIVIRLIAPLIKSKTTDPAVLVIDEAGAHVISLLSGHIGGANKLAIDVAGLIDSTPVITTATDVNHLPAVDVAAMEKGLFIENPGAIKVINMAIINREPIGIHDPFKVLTPVMTDGNTVPFTTGQVSGASLYIDDTIKDLPDHVLILRPLSLVAGIGCNRGTGIEELKRFLLDVMARFNLSLHSLHSLASIDLKSDEPGLLAMGKDLGLPVTFFSSREINTVKSIQNPSAVVEKHIGVKSVCEAAAILGAKQGKLIVPKQHTGTVTVAVARVPSIS